MSFKKPDKKALSLMRLTASAWSGLFILPLLPLLAFLFLGEQKVFALIISALVFLSFLLFIWLYPKLRYKNYGYLLDDKLLKIKQGVFFKSEHMVPLDRIHQIDIRQGPLDLLTGRAKLIITTAGSAAIIKFLSLAGAQELAENLNAKLDEKLKETKGEGHV
ncbi:MAG: PH domain-containing protein [Clostridiales bacterium]|nr:PH domain-containing protein [Clostridiales bacterium]